MKNDSNEDQIEVPLQINDYHFAAQFTIATIDDHLIDIMLGYNWLETLVTFFVNAKKKCIAPLSQTIDEESTDGWYEELEEQIKLLNKLIMDKDNELEHVQRKKENQEFELCQHQQ